MLKGLSWLYNSQLVVLSTYLSVGLLFLDGEVRGSGSSKLGRGGILADFA